MVLTSLIYFFSVFTMIMQQEELTGWHLSGVTRARIRVIGVNFSANFLVKKRKGDFELEGNYSSIRVRVNGRVK